MTMEALKELLVDLHMQTHAVTAELLVRKAWHLPDLTNVIISGNGGQPSSKTFYVDVEDVPKAHQYVDNLLSKSRSETAEARAKRHADKKAKLERIGEVLKHTMMEGDLVKLTETRHNGPVVVTKVLEDCFWSTPTRDNLHYVNWNGTPYVHNFTKVSEQKVNGIWIELE